MAMAKALTDSEAIDELGGTGAVAAIFGIRDSAVSMWRTEGIPLARRFKVVKLLREKGVHVPADFIERAAAWWWLHVLVSLPQSPLFRGRREKDARAIPENLYENCIKYREPIVSCKSVSMLLSQKCSVVDKKLDGRAAPLLSIWDWRPVRSSGVFFICTRASCTIPGPGTWKDHLSMDDLDVKRIRALELAHEYTTATGAIMREGENSASAVVARAEVYLAFLTGTSRPPEAD
jgi:hypothetical protein